MAFPVGEERIADAERALGRRFPEALRARLLENNGGEIAVDGEPWQLLPVFDPNDARRLARTPTHVVQETRNARATSGGAFPDASTVIAHNGTGDLVVLVADDDEPRFWDHETGELAIVVVDWA